MPLSRRYQEFAPGESSLFGIDMSFVLPPHVAIESATLQVFNNTFAPVAPTPDITVVGDVVIEGTCVYARLTGGVEGTDYAIRWTITDSDGNVFPRTALVLCSQTS